MFRFNSRRSLGSPWCLIRHSPDGAATVVWERYDGKETLIEAASSSSGGSFGKAEALSETGETAEQPHVAMNAEGDTAAGWVRYNGANKIAQAVGIDEVHAELLPEGKLAMIRELFAEAGRVPRAPRASKD